MLMLRNLPTGTDRPVSGRKSLPQVHSRARRFPVRVLRFVDGERRERLAREVLEGWVSGPDAPIEATAAALANAESARVVVLVEGISD